MATALGVKKVQRLVSHARNNRNLMSFVNPKRSFSEREGQECIISSAGAEGTQAVAWPDEKMGPLNVPDLRFALPGNIGAVRQSKQHSRSGVESARQDVLLEGNQERHLTVVSQLVSESDYLDFNEEPSTEMTDCILQKYFKNTRVEISVQDCPDIILKDFVSYFPEMPNDRKLTVVIIIQRTKGDMSGWSEEVELERDALTERFITAASEICHMLKAHNYWCDFVDPSTGLPYFGPYTSTTFYETDERYRHLGFQIEDLGCCKIIRHRKWGSKIFVGSIFTTAPKEHKAVQNLVKLLD